MDLKTLTECESFAIAIAIKAGEMMKSMSGRCKQIEEKQNYADIVTEADKAIESFVFEELRKQFPTHKLIGEETASKAVFTDDPTWIVDPIDGTTNFVHTFPFCCISIGLAVNKKCVVGVIYSPFLDKLYTAKKGCGAYCNGAPIRVHNCTSFQQALFICEMGNQRDDEKRKAVFANMEAVGWKCHGLRCMGSAALNICMVASGFAEAYWEFGLHCWDMAAGAIIASEAGGVVIDTEGGEFDLMSRRLIVACNESIATQLSKELPVHLKLERDD
ncbi:inositol monophosphatase-like protein [Leptotrombidium deliense]|uniref:Inositol-1-monophosphatase n=1 Tax=Leptotrombidium deliense TaxID=299467 RepID=A0A443SVW3_9ACAR|nr:inositol monophosphatase-like protein [Leptotrombidium deliense]